MKAILMFGDMVMKVMSIYRADPEIIMPIRRVLNVYAINEGELPDDLTNVLKMSFKLEEPGRRYAVYQLRGFDK